MKKLRHLLELLIFLTSYCIIPNVCFSQLNTGLGYGYDTHGRAIATWSVGYEKGRVNFQGEMRPTLSRKIEMNNLLGFRLSANLINPNGSFISILPGIGYYYNFRSEDKVKINHWEYGYSLKSIFKVTENGNIFIEGFYATSLQLVAGILFKFD